MMSQPDNWIDIKKTLPDKDAPYLIHAPSADPEKPLITTAWYDPSFGWSLIVPAWIPAITHWMPLPKPPTKKTIITVTRWKHPFSDEPLLLRGTMEETKEEMSRRFTEGTVVILGIEELWDEDKFIAETWKESE